MVRRLCLVVLLAAPFWASQVAAQGRPLQVRVRNELSFGVLLPGVPTTVLTVDPLNAGEFDIRGQKNTEVMVQFTLPAELSGAGAVTIPLIFGPGAAAWSPTADINNQFTFDLAIPQVFTLSKNGRASIFLGGTALPSEATPAGDYSNTVIIQVAYMGT